MRLNACEWSRDWNCNILISLRIQFPHFRYRFSPKPQPLVTVGVQHKSVYRVSFSIFPRINKCCQMQSAKTASASMKRVYVDSTFVWQTRMLFLSFFDYVPFFKTWKAIESNLSFEMMLWLWQGYLQGGWGAGGWCNCWPDHSSLCGVF